MVSLNGGARWSPQHTSIPPLISAALSRTASTRHSDEPDRSPASYSQAEDILSQISSWSPVGEEAGEEGLPSIYFIFPLEK